MCLCIYLNAASHRNVSQARLDLSVVFVSQVEWEDIKPPLGASPDPYYMDIQSLSKEGAPFRASFDATSHNLQTLFEILFQTSLRYLKSPDPIASFKTSTTPPSNLSMLTSSRSSAMFATPLHTTYRSCNISPPHDGQDSENLCSTSTRNSKDRWQPRLRPVT